MQGKLYSDHHVRYRDHCNEILQVQKLNVHVGIYSHGAGEGQGIENY